MSKTSDRLLINNLVYTLPSSETEALQRNDMRNYFDQRNYNAGQTIRAVFQTGARYVDVLNSSLVMDVVCSDVEAADPSWGQGSALNLIKNVRVYHKNGTELVNIQNHNVNQMIEDKCKNTREWFDNVGWLMGYRADNLINGHGTINNAGNPYQQNPIVGGSVQYIIPLPCIAPIFNPAAKQWLPNMLSAGLILEIDLATSAEAVVRTAGAADVELSVRDIYLNLSTIVLSDMAVATLNDIGSKKLIEYVYVDTYTSRLSQPQNNGTISTSVNKAVSFADHIVTGEVISANRNNQLADEFSLAGGGKSYQYQLGSVQLPSQVFTDTVHKAYLQMMKTYNKYRDDTDKSSVIYQNFGDTLQVKTCSFSKDQLLALAQMPINSSRSLRYEQNYDTAPAEARTVFVFLHYIKSLRCSLTDCTVNQ